MTPRPSAMAEGIAEWAARHGDRPAFVGVERTLTVAEVDRVAGALAARLLDSVASNATARAAWLPIVVDRSMASAVAMHGVIRGGFAFTPIESHLPRELVAEMWARLGHPRCAVVVRPEYSNRLPRGVEAIAAFGNERFGNADPQPVEHEAGGVVVFTSGTTGRPKGVMLPWSALDARVERALHDGPPPEARTWRELFVQPFGFAPAIGAIAQPCAGRTLYVVDPNTMSVDELLDWLSRQQLDSIGFPPSLSTAILRVAERRERLPTVSQFRLGGEALDWAIVDPLRRLIGPHATIRAGYATSEASRIARLDIGPGHPIGRGRIPLGRIEPGVNVRLEPLVDDPSLMQLLVANPRSLGYLGDPDLTARRYVTDERGVRWWRSGDIVDVDGDGIFHHRGRADELVKIHGLFVAPSRLEEELRAIDGIAAAAAIAHTTGSGQILLAAHVEVDDDALTPERVEKSLRARLPRHLMSAILVRHDVLPRTEREKVDKRALEAAPLIRWRSVPAREAGAEAERWCVGEVRRLVGLDDIGPDDDLFEVGLDSLSVLELCAALADAGFAQVDPPQLLEARTCAGICAMLERPIEVGISTVVALNGTGRRTPIFVLPGGGGTALKFRFLAECLGPDRPLLVVEPRGMHRAGRVDRTIAAMAAHVREEAEARLARDEPCLMVGYSASATVAYEAAQQLHAVGRRVSLLLLDGSPARRTGQRNGSIDLWDRERSQQVTIRTASRRELAGAVARSLAYRWHGVRQRWFERYPGKPRFDRDRYRGFRRIVGKAARAYDPAPAEFPATLVHVKDQELVARTELLIPGLTVRMVGGDHITMLELPEVMNLATEVTAWSDRALTEASAAAS